MGGGLDCRHWIIRYSILKTCLSNTSIVNYLLIIIIIIIIIIMDFIFLSDRVSKANIVH